MNTLIKAFVVSDDNHVEYAAIVVFPLAVEIRFQIICNICCFNAAIQLIYLILPEHLVFNGITLKNGI